MILNTLIQKTCTECLHHARKYQNKKQNKTKSPPNKKKQNPPRSSAVKELILKEPNFNRKACYAMVVQGQRKASVLWNKESTSSQQGWCWEGRGWGKFAAGDSGGQYICALNHVSKTQDHYLQESSILANPANTVFSSYPTCQELTTAPITPSCSRHPVLSASGTSFPSGLPPASLVPPWSPTWSPNCHCLKPYLSLFSACEASLGDSRFPKHLRTQPHPWTQVTAGWHLSPWEQAT